MAHQEIAAATQKVLEHMQGLSNAESQPAAAPVLQTSVRPIQHGTEEALEKETGHPIPYSRFQKAIAKKNEIQEQNAKLQSELDQLRQQLQGRNTAPQVAPAQYSQPAPSKAVETTDWLDDYLKGDVSSGEQQPDPQAQQIQQLNQRLSRFEYQKEVEQQKDKLRAELEQVKRDYPSVNPLVVLRTYAADGSKSLVDIASSIDDYESQVEERGIARFLKEQGGVSAPSWPKNSNEARSPSTVMADKPRNVKEAHQAMLRHFGVKD